MSEKLFFIGSYCPPIYVEELIQSGSIPDIAGINLQGAIIKGLHKLSIDKYVVSIPKRQSYPISKDIIIKSQLVPTPEGDVYLVGFLNLPFIKMVTKFFLMRRRLKKLLKHENNPKVLLYSLHSPLLLAIYTLRKYYSKSCVIVTDLPQYMSTNNNFFYRFAKYFDQKLIYHCLKKINGFILLSEYMKTQLPINTQPYIVMEGIYRSETDIHDIKASERNNKIIMYSGSISKRYNIWDLIHAFKMIDNPELQLWLCGYSDNITELSSIIRTDPRIRYWGLLTSLKVKEMQKKVGLLINPRYSKENYVKYSFPSKTMEYLASGTPTMMCDLPSLPKEYKKLVYLIKEESVMGIKKSIEQFFNISDEIRISKAMNAREFILRERTETPQSMKIINFINQL